MIREVFLICALALPPVQFHEPETIHEWIEQYQELKKFIHRIHPEAELLITTIDSPPRDRQYEKLPFTWNGHWVWIKRRPIFDKVSA